MGAGFTGRFLGASLSYQIYVLNGFRSYREGQGLLRGKDGLRKGRQKGIESIVHTPNVSGKISWYGLPGLEWSASVYAGKTQSDLFDHLDKSDQTAVSRADSSTVFILMGGTALRYRKGPWKFQAQFIQVQLKGTEAYNAFTGKALGSAMQGYYLEAALELFREASTRRAWVPFIRYEFYDTNSQMDGKAQPNPAYRRQAWFFGTAWKFNAGTALKLDYRLSRSDADAHWSQMLNAGVGIWF